MHLRTIAITTGAALATLGAAATPALAFSQFRTPSGNIGCYGASAQTGVAAEVRCDIRDKDWQAPAQPASFCPNLNWGDSLGIHKRGTSYWECHGDTAIDPRAKVLEYGSTWHWNGFHCTSRTSGLTCANTQGHGFFLSRQSFRRF